VFFVTTVNGTQSLLSTDKILRTKNMSEILEQAFEKDLNTRRIKHGSRNDRTRRCMDKQRLNESVQVR